jgi:DNA-binding transcriptional regulator PaaX
MFDLPARSHQLRVKLWRWLRSQRFGLLQRSLWITPDPINEALLPLSRQKLMPKTAVVVEGQPVAPASNADFVKTAWDFAAINEGYRAALDQAAHGLKLAAKPDTKSSELRQWLALERAAWVKAVGQDPLLPEALLPSGYLGSEAWARRHEAYAALAKRGFRLP